MITALRNILEREYSSLSLWYFVSFIGGIIIYFALPTEPSTLYISALLFFSLPLLTLRKHGILWQFSSSLIIAFNFGMLAGKFRVISLNNIFIEKSVISQVEGIVASIKPTTKGRQVVLRETKIYKANEKINKIRISIPTKYSNNINTHDHIKLLAKLYSPQNSLLPGGYDFGFHAYLSGIGATGYAMSPVVITASSDLYNNGIVYKIRKIIYNRLIDNLGSLKGNFAAAILLGETKAIDRQLMKDMRQSGISHILCVSGLHLSLVAMILFISIRFLLNLSNFIAFNYNIKIIAAICSLIGSYGYLELSGRQIAASRAFIMTAIFIIAIIIERACYPLRSLAIAAFIILSLNPEYIFHPSFQLSFVAVLSLVAGYEFYIKNQWVLGDSKGIFASIKFYMASNIYSSFLASIITAPVVINQFYIFSTYSIPMNLIAVPIMSFFLMPLAILALLLMPFGIEKYILKTIGFFIEIIADTAKFANEMPGSVWYFGYISKTSIVIFIFGFFWICLWKTRWRFLGLLTMIISFILMLSSPKPDLIFDAKLNAVGVKNNAGMLTIYANKMPEFNRIYWANWFGQADAEILPLTKNVFNTLYGQKIIINSNPLECKDAEICIDRTYLENSTVILIFCDTYKCKIKTDNNKRFSLASKYIQ